MRANDAVSGIVLILLAAAMAALTLGFPPFPGQKYGPALFPRLLAAGIAAGGAILVLRGLEARRVGRAWLAFDAWTRVGPRVVNFFTVIAALLFYILASERLGFLVTAVAVLLALTVRFGTRIVVAVPVALGTAVAMQWFFGTVMRVPLPRGAFGIAL